MLPFVKALLNPIINASTVQKMMSGYYLINFWGAVTPAYNYCSANGFLYVHTSLYLALRDSVTAASIDHLLMVSF